MASYSNVGGYLECTGVDITSAGIYTNLVSLGIGTGHIQDTSGGRDVYVFNSPIRIGNSGSSGSSSIWDCSNEHVKINNANFQVYGSLLMGDDDDGHGSNGGSFSWVNLALDGFRFFDNGVLRIFAAALHWDNRIRLGNSCEFTVVDCDINAVSGPSMYETSPAWSSSNCTINWDRSRLHDGTGTGIKLQANATGNTVSFNKTKIQNVLYAFQLGSDTYISPVFIDVEIDSCTYHTVPNKGDSTCVFVNPDFTVYRSIQYDSNDVAEITFRYTLIVKNSAGVDVTDAEVYIVDENGDVQADATFDGTMASLGLDTYSSIPVLYNATYNGVTRTERKTHSRTIYHYNYNINSSSIVIDQDTYDPVALAIDSAVTETNKAAVSAYTTIDNLDELYDYAKYWKVSGSGNYSYPALTELLCEASGNVLDFGAKNITFNTGAGSVLAVNTGTDLITVKPTSLNATTKFDTIKTTGAVIGFTGTAKIQSATLDFPTAGAYSGTYIGITADFSGTGAFDLTGATISGTIELTNSSGGAVTVQVATGTSYTNTGPSITVQEIGDTPTLTVSADSATATVRGFTNDTQTTIFNESDGSVDYEYPNTNPIDIEIVELGYVPINDQNVVPFDGPINYTMDLDEAYNASHSLTIATHYTYNRATKAFAILADQNAFDVRSSMADTIRTNSSYYNTPLLLEAKPGGKRIDLIDGATISSMANWKGAGMERYDAADAINPVEKWYSIQSVNNIAGSAVVYRQTNSGDFTVGSLTNNVFDETLQFYSDPDHDGTPATENNSYLLIKALRVGYRQARNDVVAGNGGASLKADLYTIGLAPTAHDYAGNPATDLSLTMTLVAGGTVGGKTFAYKWVDAGTNSGTDIADWINYMGATTPNGLIPGSTGLRWAEMPDMVIYVSGGVETAQGYREGATPTLVGFYMERGGSDHPGMVRAQADDGTYYTPAVTANITITNLPDDVGGNTRLQIYNVTTATEYYNDDPAGTGYSASYTDGVGISSGDQLRIRFAHLNAGTSFEYGQTFVTASSSGFSADGSTFITADSVYASNGINGSTITNFTADFVEDQIEIASDTDFTAAQAYAFYCYNLTDATGIGDFWGGVTAIDTGNYRINTSVVSIYFDSPVGVTYSVKQTDTGRIFRSDDAYPVKDPTTSGYGVQLNWKNVVYVQNVGGSALTAAESAALTSIKSKTDSLTFTVAGQVDANCESMNAHALQGDGSESDKIRTINAP